MSLNDKLNGQVIKQTKNKGEDSIYVKFKNRENETALFRDVCLGGKTMARTSEVRIVLPL